MGKRRRVVVGVVAAIASALLVGVFAVDASLAATRERDAALERFGGERVEVVVALRELAVGESVTRQDVELRPWLVDLVPEGAASAIEDVVGHRVSYPIAENEPVLAARLDRADTALSVPQGSVAVSVPASDVLAVGGAIHEGDRVDVYSSASAKTVKLLSNALVLATSASSGAARGSMLASGSSSDIDWVTLAVEPARVEEVVAASRQGNLYFTLPGEAAPKEQAEGAASDAQASKDGGDAK